MGEFAWVTLATNDSYSLGALVLAHSLKQLGTKHSLVVLITPGVSTSMGEKLSEVFNLVEAVNLLDSQDAANLRLLKRPELGVTFTKLHCWRLTQFDKCVFLDADTLVLQNCDELFEREELSAAPDVGWPDCFNSGVFVYRPSLDTYEKLIQFALDKGSFDGGDQGLLNLYFSDWAHKDISKHLPFIYNMCSTASYSYLPAFKQFGTSAKIIHFIGATKPWLQYFDSESKKVHSPSGYQHLNSVLQLWWDIFCSLIHPNLSSNMTGLAGAFSKITLGVARTEEQSALEDHLRRQGWEVGNIDYLGRDSFDNIWTKICETLSSPPEEEAVQEPVAVLEPTATPTAETPATEANVEPISEVIQDTLKSTSPTESSTETYKSDITPTEQTVPAPKPALRPLTLIKEFPMPQVCPIIPSAPIFETCTLLESPVADVEALIELGDYVDFQQNIAEITDPIVTAQCTRIVAHSEVLPMEKLEAVPMETLSETSHTSSLDMPPLSGAKIGVKEATPVLQPPVIEGESDLPKSVPNVPQIPLTPAPTSQQSTLTDSVSSGPIEPPKSAPVSLTELDAPTKSASDVLPTPVSEIPKSSESSAKVQATIEQKSLTKEQPIAVEAVKAVGEIVPPKIPDSAVPSTTLPKETEKLLEASQLPEAPKLPEAAKLPAPPKLPETAKLPEHPKLPEAAKLPEPPKLPKPPKLPPLFKTPEYPKPPTPPQTPESPKASEAPKVISGLKASKDVKTTTKSEPVPVEPKPGAIKAPKSQEVAAPKTPDVTGATPPVTPGTASVQAQSKASSVDAPLPAIPQPNTAEGQTPTPPPRKTASNAAKKSSKPKK